MCLVVSKSTAWLLTLTLIQSQLYDNYTMTFLPYLRSRMRLVICRYTSYRINGEFTIIHVREEGDTMSSLSTRYNSKYMVLTQAYTITDSMRLFMSHVPPTSCDEIAIVHPQPKYSISEHKNHTMSRDTKHVLTFLTIVLDSKVKSASLSRFYIVSLLAGAISKARIVTVCRISAAVENASVQCTQPWATP